MSPRVTIVTRTRDRSVLLRRALASVGAQGFEDYELVVVNDGGRAKDVERIVGELPPAQRGRVRVVHNPESHGRESALEDGLAVSSGEFFAVHDDDDTWDPRFLEQCVRALDDAPEHAAVATRCDVVHEHLEDGAPVEDSREVLASTTYSWTLVDTLVMNAVPPISQLVRRSVADEIGHWSRVLSTQADWDFNLRLLSHHPVGFLADEVLAHWHQRPATGGPDGNSVVDDATQHAIDNLAIRDAYARTDADGPLGTLPVLAEYYRRLAGAQDTHAAGLHRALSDVHASVLKNVDEELARQRGSLEGLHVGLGQALALLQAQQDEIAALRQDAAAARAEAGAAHAEAVAAHAQAHAAREEMAGLTMANQLRGVTARLRRAVTPHGRAPRV